MASLIGHHLHRVNYKACPLELIGIKRSILGSFYTHNKVQYLYDTTFNFSFFRNLNHIIRCKYGLA